jgi:ubiquinone/menaquinone biosynthesis C-methylase UbiE
MTREPDPRFGLQRGAVFPARASRLLLTPARRFVHPPESLARRLQIEPTHSVLEIGCGPGWFSPALGRAAVAGALHLVDLQPEMLGQARQRAGSVSRSGHGGTTAVAAEADHLPYRSSAFDRALLAAVLGETPDPAAAVHEASRVLKPGGLLAVLETRTDPDFIPFSQLLEIADGTALRLVRRFGRVGYTAIFEVHRH